MAWSTGASPEEKLKGNIRNDFFKEQKASKNFKHSGLMAFRRRCMCVLE